MSDTLGDETRSDVIQCFEESEHILNSDLNTENVLKLSASLCITPDILLDAQVKASSSPNHHRRPELLLGLVQAVAALEPTNLKSVLASLAIPSEPLNVPESTNFMLVQLKIALNRKGAREYRDTRNIFILLAAHSDVASTSEALQVICAEMDENKSWSDFFEQVQILLLLGANPLLQNEQLQTPRELLHSKLSFPTKSSPQQVKDTSPPDSDQTCSVGFRLTEIVPTAKGTEELLKTVEDYYRSHGENNPLIPSNGLSIGERIVIFNALPSYLDIPGWKASAIGGLGWLDDI